MLLPYETAATYLDITVNNLTSYRKYRKFIKNGKFDMDAYQKEAEVFQQKENYCFDALNFIDFVIEKEGTLFFYRNFEKVDRENIRDAVAKCKISFRLAELVFETLPELKEAYELGEEIAKELNVPTSWVQSEIHGIKTKGRKGYVMPTEERKKHENQPHAKPIVQICPKTFEIVKEYSSQGAVERHGFKRENVRKAIRSGGLSKNYLWAFKGMEKPTIESAIKRGNLNSKLQAQCYKKPTKIQLKKLYIDADMTLKELGRHFKCHHTTIAILAGEYGLKKRSEKISVETLRNLYIERNMSVAEIAAKHGYSKSSISTYLSKNGIKRRAK